VPNAAFVAPQRPIAYHPCRRLGGCRVVASAKVVVHLPGMGTSATVRTGDSRPTGRRVSYRCGDPRVPCRRLARLSERSRSRNTRRRTRTPGFEERQDDADMAGREQGGGAGAEDDRMCDEPVLIHEALEVAGDRRTHGGSSSASRTTTPPAADRRFALDGPARAAWSTATSTWRSPGQHSLGQSAGAEGQRGVEPLGPAGGERQAESPHHLGHDVDVGLAGQTCRHPRQRTPDCRGDALARAAS
jgi:hypothetical protein